MIAIRIREPEGDPLEPLRNSARQLGPDELRVLVTIAERLVAGRAVYGELHVADDPRRMKQEAGEELLDACVYLAADVLKRKDAS